MLETSVQVSTTIPNSLPEAVLRQAYRYPLKPNQHYSKSAGGKFTKENYKKNRRSNMSPRSRDQKIESSTSPRPISSGSEEDVAPNHGSRVKKMLEDSHDHERRRGQFYNGYQPHQNTETHEKDTRNTTSYNFNNSNNIWQRGHNNYPVFRGHKQEDSNSEYEGLQSEGSRTLPLQPRPVRLSAITKGESTWTEEVKDRSVNSRDHSDGEENEHSSNRKRHHPSKPDHSITPPRSSKRYKSFGINEIIGESSTENDTDKMRLPSPAQDNKRKMHECNTSEITKRRRSESGELSARDNSPVTSDYASPVKDANALNGDAMSALPLHTPQTHLPNPYILNALAGQDPALLSIAPHLMADPNLLMRSALPRLGMSGINPYLFPQMLRRPVPGYDVNYMLEQQQMLALLNQTKSYPWYQMNPLLRAMTNGTNDPLVMASLLSAQKRADVPPRQDIPGMYAGHNPNTNLPTWNLQQNLLKQMQRQSEDCKKEPEAVHRPNTPDVPQSPPRNHQHHRHPKEKIHNKNHKLSSSEMPSINSIRHTSSSKLFHHKSPKKISNLSSIESEAKSNKKQHRTPSVKQPNRCSLPLKPTKIITKNETMQPRPSQPLPKLNEKLHDVTDDKTHISGQSTPSKSASYKNLTRERRLVANARERTRVHTISSAFEELRGQIPSYSCNQKLSKLAILRIACSYIKSLSVLSGYDVSGDGKFDESVESCTKVLQSESRARSRRKSNRTHSDWDGDSHNKSTGSSSGSPGSTHSTIGDPKHKPRSFKVSSSMQDKTPAKINHEEPVFGADSPGKFEDDINVED